MSASIHFTQPTRLSVGAYQSTGSDGTWFLSLLDEHAVTVTVSGSIEDLRRLLATIDSTLPDDQNAWPEWGSDDWAKDTP